MNLLDPYRHVAVREADCETLPAIDGYAPTRPFGTDQWFLRHVATGRTKPIDAISKSVVEHLTIADSIDAASFPFGNTDPHFKAVFVDAPPELIESIDVPLRLTASVPPVAEPLPMFSCVHRGALAESVASREGLMVDVSKLSAADVDAAVNRLRGLGYDCMGLVVGESRPERLEAVRRAFGGQVAHVKVEDARDFRASVMSLIQRPIENPKGKEKIDAAAKKKAKRSTLAAAFTPAKRKRSKAGQRRADRRATAQREARQQAGPSRRPPLMLMGESIDDEDPHATVPGWQLPRDYNWKLLSYGTVLHDGRGHLLLREPTNHFGGYVWTFPKGKMDNPDEHPSQVAKREAAEETGYYGILDGYIPGAYKGGTGWTYYYTMLSTRRGGEMDDETYRTRWATPDEAAELIQQTPNTQGRLRDLAVLKAAATALHLPYNGPKASPAATPPVPPVSKARQLFSKLAGAFKPQPKQVPGGTQADSPQAPPSNGPKVNLNPWASKPYKPPKNLFGEAIDEGLFDPYVLKAVFLAGGAGSGKSFIGQKMFGGSGLRVIGSDQALEFLMKKQGLDPKTDVGSDAVQLSGGIRHQAKEQTKVRTGLAIEGRQGVVLDGTGKTTRTILRAKSMFEAAGYDTYMVMVTTPLEKAVENNRKRSRTLSDELVKETWQAVQEAIPVYKAAFGKGYVEIKNDEPYDDAYLTRELIPQLTRKAMKLLDRPIENPIGKAWIDVQVGGNQDIARLARRAQKAYKESLDEDGSPTDSGNASSLAKFIVANLKQQFLLQVVRPIALYKARGDYDRSKSSRLARHLVVAGGKAYARAKKLPGAWHEHFSQGTRERAEVLVRNAGESAAASHKYDALLPAKWRKGFKGYDKAKAESVESGAHDDSAFACWRESGDLVGTV